VPRELVDDTARPLSITFDQSRQLGEVTEDWRKANATSRRTQGTKGLSVSSQSLGRPGR